MSNIKKKKKTYPIIMEFLPLIIFFIISREVDILVATMALMIAGIFNLIASYVYTKHFHMISIITCILAVVFGGLTLFFNNANFIKIKITVINLCFALGLCTTYVMKRNMLRITFGDRLYLKVQGWKILNILWIIFFVFLASLNEIVWRNYSTNTWVNFKVFIIPLLTLIFLLVQLPLINKYKKKTR